MRNDLSKMRRGRVLFGDAVIEVWVAHTSLELVLGLSRISPDELGNRGMLFIDAWETDGFHMPNMLMALDIAFLDEDGTVIHLGTMARDMQGSIRPARPAACALELPEGRLRELGAKPGDRFGIEID